MTVNLKEDFSFLTGAVRRKDLAYVALVDDERAAKRDEHSVPLIFHAGKWIRFDEGSFDWVITGACVVREPVEQGVFVGVMGEVICAGSGDVHPEQIVDGSDSPASRGPLRSVTGIDGRAYAVGTGRQVYRRDGRDTWVALDRQLRPTPKDAEFVSLESIDGFDANEIYAAGVYGEIWRYDGRNWEQIQSPTNLILSKVCCAGNGTTYLAGQQGVLVRGRGTQWEALQLPGIDDTIWGLAWYGDKLYLSTLANVYTLEGGDRAEPVSFGEDRPGSCYHLSAADGVLWSVGRKDVMSFDGNVWTRID